MIWGKPELNKLLDIAYERATSQLVEHGEVMPMILGFTNSGLMVPCPAAFEDDDAKNRGLYIAKGLFKLGWRNSLCQLY